MVLGLTSVPGAGDSFIVVEEDRIARQIADRRSARERNAQLASNRRRISLDDLDKALAAGEVQQLNLIIKGDVSGSVEALEDSLLKIELNDGNDEVSLRVIGRGVGAITENDINLAIASDAVVIGFNVRPEGKAREAAEREGVDVRYYTVIYQAIDEIEAALKGMLKPEFEEAQLGTAEVREVFRVPKIGNVAGSIVRRAPSGVTPRPGWSATASSSTSTWRWSRCAGSRTTRPRSARASSAVSGSARSTTSRSATSSRPSRCARSRAAESAVGQGRESCSARCAGAGRRPVSHVRSARRSCHG